MSTMNAAVPVLPVGDTKKATQFYVARLGFEEDYCDDSYAIVHKDRIEIHLWAATDTRWQDRKSDIPVVSGAETFLAGTASCRVDVFGIDEICTEYGRVGVLHPNGPLRDTPYGCRECAVLDLDGNLITFFQSMK